jgi:hypothetical protein
MPEILSNRSIILGRYRFFNASMVARVVYIISAELIEPGIFLINNIIDWGEYTELYILEWKKETMQAAKIIKVRKRDKKTRRDFYKNK